jgi:hypothetical protein
MHRNTAEMRSSESPMDIGISAEKNTAKLEHRFAVAPMMDWTDEVYFGLLLSDLAESKNACRLYVASEN